MAVRPSRKRDVVGKDELARKTRLRLKQMMKVSKSMLAVFSKHKLAGSSKKS
jgi:tRNA A37 threonylcarbamoyladenosine dehydratase